jgi:hypothetical protein
LGAKSEKEIKTMILLFWTLYINNKLFSTTQAIFFEKFDDFQASLVKNFKSLVSYFENSFLKNMSEVLYQFNKDLFLINTFGYSPRD